MEDLRFEDVRLSLNALEILRDGRTSDHDDLLECRWQEDASEAGFHVSIFCNLLEQAQTLEDLLEHGLWCDPMTIPSGITTGWDVEPLVRYYALAFLVREQIEQDLSALLTVATGDAKRHQMKSVERITGWTNNVFKHRSTGLHRWYHHGACIFADHPNYESAIKDLDVYSPETMRPDVSPKSVLAIPSLTAACDGLVHLYDSANQALMDSGGRERIQEKFGIEARALDLW